MRVLVVGSGGREHALLWALHRDLPEATLFAAPGNPGTAILGTNLEIPTSDIDALVRTVETQRIDLTVVGPEAPLAAGLADRLRSTGRAVFGPSRAAAQLEASKAFAKEVMVAAGVATASAGTFRDLSSALGYIDGQAEPLVVKASGLAAGKGVVVCAHRAEARRVVRSMLEDHRFGDAGREVVIEQYLEGEELSVLALTDGEQLLILPPAQDHKRLGDGDTGPNTGGMGAYCPVSIANPAVVDGVRRHVFQPTLEELSRRGVCYQGVLYAGLMMRPDGTAAVLEFNCRFGDPEAQAVLPALAPGISRHLAEIAHGEWRPGTDVLPAARAAVTTVLAAPGYPEHPESGAAITISSSLFSSLSATDPDVLLFHAATGLDADGTLRVRGGRVFGVTGLGTSVPEAARRSREASDTVRFQGKICRRDIGWREIRRAGAA